MSLYAHTPLRTAGLWEIYIYFLFPEIIFIINSVKCLVKKISELDHKVPGAARNASRKCCVEIRGQKQVVSGQSVKSNAISVAV